MPKNVRLEVASLLVGLAVVAGAVVLIALNKPVPAVLWAIASALLGGSLGLSQPGKTAPEMVNVLTEITATLRSWIESLGGKTPAPAAPVQAAAPPTVPTQPPTAPPPSEPTPAS